MKIALAQIDARLGDIEGICERIADQARLARERGARVMCTPSPLFAGLMPNMLIEEANYEHDLLTALEGLARRVEELDIVLLVPAVVAFEHAPLFEVFMLKQGRTVPVRSLLAYRRNGAVDDLWAPPVFDIDDTRFAVTFDLARDLPLLPPGCDVAVCFQSSSFDTANEETAGVAAVADGHFAPEVAKQGVWLAWMAPVGAYEDAAFTGGSFVMDDAGRVVACSPCFEEDLLIQEICRGAAAPALPAHELPQYQREEWLWEALRLHLADAVRALGSNRAVLVLEGDLPSSLAAALAVDALGPRNVHGLFIERDSALTPAQEEAERRRAARVRALASGLKIPLLELPAPAARLLDLDEPALDAQRLRERIAGLYLEDAAARFDAVAVSPLTKTEAALAAPALAGSYLGDVAPFGDVYLTALEFVARVRCHAGSAVPAEVVSLRAVEDAMRGIVARGVGALKGADAYRERIAATLGVLAPAQIDRVLEEHVEQGRALDDISLAAQRPDAVALLLMLVRTSEAARRRLPLAPIVSARSFSERSWPSALAWLDTGRGGAEALTTWNLVEAEVERFAARGAEHGERVGGEVMAVIASLLGLPVDQLEGTPIESELLRRLRRGMEPGDDEADAPDHPGPQPPLLPGARQQGFSFFSLN